MSGILAIDYGKSKIGLAFADEALKIAMPYAIIKNNGIKNVLEQLKKICEEKDVQQIVIGEPSRLTDSNKQLIEEIEMFAKKVKKFLDISVDFENERMTTKIAKSLLRTMRTNKDDDAVAAMIILQDYLDK